MRVPQPKQCTLSYNYAVGCWEVQVQRGHIECRGSLYKCERYIEQNGLQRQLLNRSQINMAKYSNMPDQE